MVEKRERSIRPDTFFLIAAMWVGIFYCVAIPYGAGFDEERHLVRIYWMSKYEFMPNLPNQIVHEDVFELSYQRRFVQTPAFDMFGKEIFLRRFSTFDEYRYGQKTQSIYSPIIFLPQALIGRLLWWKYDFPILPTIIVQRVAGLLIYIAGAYAMIRIAPFGKWLLAAVALMPAALYQASTLNADGFTAAVSFAFIGAVVSVYVNEKAGIRPRSIWILALLSILLGTAKPGSIILLPLLLILSKHPLPSRKWMIVLVAGVTFAAAVNIGWWMVASQRTTFSGEGAQSVSRQLDIILSDPLGFLGILLQGMMLTFPDQLRSWVAAYGYGAGKVPQAVYFFSVIFLVAALLAERRAEIPAKVRLFWIGLFLFCCVSIYTIAFIPNYATGGLFALAKHGRYYIPFTPLFFLGVAGWFEVRDNVLRFMQRLVIVSFALVTLYHSLGLYTTYYTYCGYEAYAGGKCILPIYKNLEKENLPGVTLHEGSLVNQTFTNLCGKLEAVQVFVNSMPENSQGALRFLLFDDDHHLLASQDFAPREIIIGEYLSLPVNLPADFQSTHYEIQLEPINLSPSEAFEIAVTSSEAYSGTLWVNGEARRDVLLLHYVCASP